MKLIGNNPEKISIIHYREWPVFKEFRKTEQFLKAYQEIFNETFDLKPAQSSFTDTESNNKN
jgi:predicted transcriptional regulator YdeE